MIAMPVAACGGSKVASVSGLKGILGDDLLTAQGKTRKDQEKIDATLEAGISAGIWNRPN